MLKRHTHPVRRRRKRQRRRAVSELWRRQFNREARALGLSEEDYYKLVLTLSQTLRESMTGDNGVDLSAAVRIINHPMFPFALQFISKSVIAAFQSNEDNKASSPALSPGVPQMPQSIPPMTQGSGGAAPTPHPMHRESRDGQPPRPQWQYW